VSLLTKTIFKTEILRGAERLLARAQDSYGLSIDQIVDRLRKGIEKYVLADEPNPKPAELAQFIDAIHADDLCLVVACEARNENAWSDLMARFGATVRSAARSVAGSEDAADDLAQSIWAELHGLRERDGKPGGKIGYYSGRGSLGGWLRAVVGQLAVDQHRRQSRFVQAEEESELDRLSNSSDGSRERAVTSAVGSDPEASYIENSMAASVESALAKSLGELSAEDRLLVKLYYFDGLKLREAGAILGVHEATASRRLTRVQTDLRKRVEDLLTKEHSWSKAEVLRGLSQAAKLLQSDIEAMVTGMSGHDPPGSNTSAKL
jgi:RNA polymerase sigma-70 factor, ECF subfamily